MAVPGDRSDSQDFRLPFAPWSKRQYLDSSNESTKLSPAGVDLSQHAFQRQLAAILTLIVFANAFLLFSVEPMFSKMVLPLLGGTPSVWNTCLVFFQAALLAGYGYAHALTRIRNQ